MKILFFLLNCSSCDRTDGLLAVKFTNIFYYIFRLKTTRSAGATTVLSPLSFGLFARKTIFCNTLLAEQRCSTTERICYDQ